MITPSLDATSPILILFYFVALLLAGAYFALFWILKGQTPGKMALGIKIISTDGSPITTGQAIMRFIGYIIGAIIMFLGFIWAAFDSKRQGWHDKIAETYVVPKSTQFSVDDIITVTPSKSAKVDIFIVFLLIIGVLLALITQFVFTS
jgi:uncharacterized RDD family membrane protein YckC